MDSLYIAALQGVMGFGSRSIKNLINVLGSAKAVWDSSEDMLLSTGFINENMANNLREYRKTFLLENLEKTLLREDIKYITYFDDGYPYLLSEIQNSPIILFYKGELCFSNKSIGMVGTRRATPYGKKLATRFSGELAERGVVIVSGGARGIDRCAHEGAIEAGGKTIAVLGCGLDIVYPTEHKDLYKKIIDNGGMLISEFPPGIPPLPMNFPMRNRIISGISQGVIVVEAKVRSGALITADLALADNRDVFAVPGSLFNEYSDGPHRLIKDGAIILTESQRIIDEYAWDEKVDKKSNSQIDNDMLSLTFEERSVLSVLADGQPHSIDDIIIETELSLSKVQTTLFNLEMYDCVNKNKAGSYVLISRR